ncbi:hypothetical protein BJ166DRAFT_58836 [Pestalotiopsis sp. NC0098]|nr:hypothetical protein BJ166DRAFT_58836 [Pestalotiopsis sp. NC0098]
MQLQFTLVSALLASVATAYPVSDEPQTSKRDVDASVFKRATPGSVNCGPDGAYDVSWVQSAFDDMQKYVNVDGSLRPSAGSRTYPLRNQARDPDVATALDGIAGCETGQANMVYWEFPLTSDGWNGGPEQSQGPDRVIGIGQSPGQGGTWALTYCLSVTHRGQANNDNVPCADA